MNVLFFQNFSKIDKTIYIGFNNSSMLKNLGPHLCTHGLSWIFTDDFFTNIQECQDTERMLLNS